MADGSSWPRPATHYAELIAAAGGRLLQERRGRGGDLYIALYESPAYDLDVAPLTVSRLSVNLRSVPVTGHVGDGHRASYAGRRYSLFLTPEQTEAHWRKEASSRHITIYFRRQALEEATGGSGAIQLLEQPLVNVQLPRLRPWIDALELAMTQDAPFVEDAATGLARAMLCMVAKPSGTERSKLSPEALARLRDYIAVHLARGIRVADLAAAVNMTPGAFVVAFKATTGGLPHRFVVEQRIVHAVELLQRTRLSLVDVAAVAGFSSQQHMTTAMRRLAGKTPAQFRRDA